MLDTHSCVTPEQLAQMQQGITPTPRMRMRYLIDADGFPDSAELRVIAECDVADEADVRRRVTDALHTMDWHGSIRKERI